MGLIQERRVFSVNNREWLCFLYFPFYIFLFYPDTGQFLHFPDEDKLTQEHARGKTRSYFSIMTLLYFLLCYFLTPEV